MDKPTNEQLRVCDRRGMAHIASCPAKESSKRQDGDNYRSNCFSWTGEKLPTRLRTKGIRKKDQKERHG
jgi:hypothetical protein